MSLSFRKIIFTAVFCMAAIFLLWDVSHAQTVDDLKNRIEARNEEIKKLEEEAAEFRKEVETRQEQGKTLKTELSRIDKTVIKLRSDVALTEKKIQKAELEIEKFSLEIKQREFEIKKLRGGLAALIQDFFERKQEPILFALLRHSFLSDFFRDIDYLSMIEKRLVSSLDTLHELRADLEEKQNAEMAKKAELAGLHSSLQGQNRVQQTLRSEKNELLAVTKNQEKAYAKLLTDNEKRRESLEGEIRELEEKIRVTIDPASLPAKGSGVLGFPIEGLRLASCFTNNRGAEKYCITQFFGYTSFAAVGGYGGKGHNGIDIRAESGTPVYSSSDGTVTVVGDTDIACRRASYGKWILIRHPNNLSTLYAHLSAINVSQDQEIKRGERIGFSGSSGYATGPHLHFGVFASQAVRVETLHTRTCGRNITVPIAPINGYLNPMDYL
ncbi:MAG: peptidoglycan DD-metalloendopeptidase family protein [Candidatus Sungbacteria bacterium]|nr:peptidoglycan DD-metalloendopeptidase family protein [Candidatus Sungbacteria bacterium]